MKSFLLIALLILPALGGDYDKLIAYAEKWGVPKPHPKSTFIKMWAFRSGSDDFYHLGFVAPGELDTALVGFKKLKTNERTSTPPIQFSSLEPSRLKDFALRNPFENTHLSLVTSIQLIWLGHEEIGEKFLKESLKNDAGHHRSPFHIKKDQLPELTLAASCLGNAIDEITTPDPDFKVIRDRMQLILTDFPQLKTKATDYTLKALQASLDHPAAKPGSIEALIDDFLMSGGSHGMMSHSLNDRKAKEALTLKGFEAIPHLIKHLDDKRMTNHLMQGFNNFSSYPMTADLVINSFLQSFANDEFGSNWLERQKGFTSEKDAIQAWWKSASAMGERNYISKHTLTKREKKKVTISEELLLIAVDRYPDLLPQFYTTILKTKTHSWTISDPLSTHPKIPLATRKKLLLKGIATGAPEHRNAALSGLLEIDRDAGEEILLRLIKKGPKTTKDEYWTDQNASLTRFVSKSKNPAIWKSTHDYLHRSLLGMRMELISNLRPPKDAPREILFSFFQVFDRYAYDKTVRDENSSSKFDGPGAGFPYTKIELGNFIHSHYDGWLDLEVRSPDKRTQTPEKWARYRLTVARAVQAYRRKHHLLKAD